MSWVPYDRSYAFYTWEHLCHRKYQKNQTLMGFPFCFSSLVFYLKHVHIVITIVTRLCSFILIYFVLWSRNPAKNMYGWREMYRFPFPCRYFDLMNGVMSDTCMDVIVNAPCVERVIWAGRDGHGKWRGKKRLEGGGLLLIILFYSTLKAVKSSCKICEFYLKERWTKTRQRT